MCARALDHLAAASVALSLCGSLFLCSPASAAEPEPELPATEEPEQAQARLPSPWPELAAVFPGVLVHGSGTWLQGRSETSQRLLLLEGAGLLGTFASGAVLFNTGAARNLVGPTALTAAASVGTFGLSLLASLYATWSPRAGWGAAARRSAWLESSLGYLYVQDPQFSFRHFATTRLDARLAVPPFGALHVALGTAHAPNQGNQRYELTAGLRLLEPASAGDGSYLEPQIGYVEHRFDGAGFVTRVLELELSGRLDLDRLLPDVHGAFFQLGAGWAEQWFAFDLPGVDELDATSLLLAHLGFGVYVRRAGELELYYDHRHDGFAGGLKVRGLGSGAAGHLGLRGQVLLSPAWGVQAEAQAGSAWVLGVSALLRVGGEP